MIEAAGDEVGEIDKGLGIVASDHTLIMIMMMVIFMMIFMMIFMI